MTFRISDFRPFLLYLRGKRWLLISANSLPRPHRQSRYTSSHVLPKHLPGKSQGAKNAEVNEEFAGVFGGRSGSR